MSWTQNCSPHECCTHLIDYWQSISYNILIVLNKIGNYTHGYGSVEIDEKLIIIIYKVPNY